MTTDPTPATAAAPWLPMWLKVLCIGAAGAAGALARWGLGDAVQALSGSKAFPWGIFVCNVLGCLLFGVVVGALNNRQPDVPAELQLILLTGFFGAFTTFSTFAHQSLAMLLRQEFGMLLLNVGGQLVVGLSFVFVGMVAGHRMGEALLGPVPVP
ncbi:MAG: CrcB family protein [Planctomycetota bacterium]